MSTVELEEDVDVTTDDPAEGSETSKESTKNANLKKRREVDDLLEERRLQKQLADYDFDL
ncbi:PA3496 family putative envelope integrity protein [Pseudomonas sp. R5(2019)]|uniref:PA3496 family putative envelope integrity protein n=1 Tax=Pseudomonas sp. R5(2019) TaxID=2697566 RepID=UPI0014130522|nr:hypothetical protein [Pseudomonas sp. R5(2019)]NBA94582.1 hypothetical protein [Pseudomonas sp. R5(2019)]